MIKRFMLSIGFFAYFFLLSGSEVFALSFNIVPYNVGSQPDSVVAVDFNQDGKLDLAVSNADGNNVSILLGKGDGTFSAAVTYGAGNNPSSVAVGDFDRDGILDLAVSNFNSNNVSILLGKGNGTFNPAVNYTAGNNPSSVAVGDFDRDGILDLAVPNSNGNNVSILFGNENGSFDAGGNYGAGSNPSSVAVGDFNGDGKLDLAVANSASNNVSILIGNGNGTFNPAVNYTVGNGPSSVAVGDFDGDGKLDLAVANSASNNVSILPGNGNGTFQPAENYTVGSGPSSVAVGDFNKDGKLDLAVANSAGNNVSVLLNTTSAITVPGAPKKVKATASSEQATVSFLPPESDGGSPVISYTVTSSPGKITATGTSSPITVTGLTNGVAYTFTVTATNAVGTGPASAPSDKVIPGPRISVKPKSVNLGSVRVESTSAPRTVTIKNIGNQDLVIDLISIAGADESEFIETNDCSTVPSASSCSVTVTFAPEIPFGKKSATLSISSDDPNKPTINVKLSGKAAPPKISVSPKSIKLGSVTVGNTSPPKTITIKNTGISDLTIDDISITGTDGGEFSQTSSCGTISKGESCTIDVTFAPVLAGKKSASMGISSNDPKHPVVTVKLGGVGM